MTKQVNNFNKTRLPIGTLTNFHKKVLTLIGTTTAAALHVEGLEPPYTAAVETLSSIVNRPTTYVATQSRQDVDDRRDRFVGVIHQIINAHKTSIKSSTPTRPTRSTRNGRRRRRWAR